MDFLMIINYQNLVKQKTIYNLMHFKWCKQQKQHRFSKSIVIKNPSDKLGFSIFHNKYKMETILIKSQQQFSLYILSWHITSGSCHWNISPLFLLNTLVVTVLLSIFVVSSIIYELFFI